MWRNAQLPKFLPFQTTILSFSNNQYVRLQYSRINVSFPGIVTSGNCVFRGTLFFGEIMFTCNCCSWNFGGRTVVFGKYFSRQLSFLGKCCCRGTVLFEELSFGKISFREIGYDNFVFFFI